MHLAILMTNTDESDFARAHPKDGEKFTSLVHLVRPDWTTEVFSVKDDVFPAGLEWFDGVMITGSPASVHDGAPWIARLTDLIRDIAACGKPIFGACFGHQAVAMALGGEVGPNPGGWVLGLTQMDVVDRPAWAADLGAHLAIRCTYRAGDQVARRRTSAACLAGVPAGRFCNWRPGLYNTKSPRDGRRLCGGSDRCISR